ncbi:MAG TPA: serine hydrolase [Nitrospiraceae bacterium]|jgi:CubicO group peptidase (beta-lactamase class C family)|nr:serine hydrolase [Nitrospiraceae bacterium]
MGTNHVIHTALQSAVDDGVFPGAQLAVRLRGELQCVVVAGRLSSEPPGPPVQPTTIYDLASLTKPLATVTSILLLTQCAKVALGDSVQAALPELEGAPIGQATVRELLTHRSGLPGWRPFFERLDARGMVQGFSGGDQSFKQDVLKLIRDEPLMYTRGEKSVYSDLGFMLLGFLVERLSGKALDLWCDDEIVRPLRADPLIFCPTAGRAQFDVTRPTVDISRIAPTERDEWRDRLLHGEVHDENAAAMGGVAGHAGLFGTAESVLAVSGAWLRGYHGRESILDRELVRQFTTRQEPVAQSSWALGWDTPSAPSSSGSRFSERSFGHLGYTGTSLWIDPLCELEVVLLSNRVHPSRRNEKIKVFRPCIHDLVYREFVSV